MQESRAILFVDDSAVARAATVRRLVVRGLPVTALASSREAEGVDPTSFAAALLDIDLGDGFGPDLAAHLRSASPALPIAFLTSGVPSSLLEAALAFGPVFEKVAGVEEAIGWVMAVVGM